MCSAVCDYTVIYTKACISETFVENISGNHLTDAYVHCDSLVEYSGEMERLHVKFCIHNTLTSLTVPERAVFYMAPRSEPEDLDHTQR